MNRAVWELEANELATSLRTDLNQGLSLKEAESRLAREGANQLRSEKRVSVAKRILRQFQSPVILALLLASGVSIVVGEPVDAAAILVIVVLNATISLFQEARAEAAAAELKKLSAPRARVVRSGQTIEIEASNVVSGDLLYFEAGDYLAADARVVEAHQLAASEAALTGESMPVSKIPGVLSRSAPLAERTNMVFAGTAIVAGSGRAIVSATGMKTELGKIAELLESTPSQETPLQKNIAQVSYQLLILSGGIVVLIALLGLWSGRHWLDVLMSAISLAVAAIPEGLPAVVTIALTLAVRRMTGKRAIVRHLPAVETLGSTDVICTDKTGTLTTGQMSLREVATLGDGIVPFDPVAALSPEQKNVLIAAVLSSNATYGPDGGSGDTTEVALVQAAFLADHDPAVIRQESPRLEEWSFDSDRKRMSAATLRGEDVYLYVKGAPESVLPRCELSPDDRVRVESMLAWLSQRGRRVLALAEKGMHVERTVFGNGEAWAADDVERDLTFLGLVAIADPPRMETVESIARCKAAGIRVVMITGDHPVTARAIASELGVVEPGRFEGVLTGAELERLSDEELRRTVGEVAVYARVSPQDKLRIVTAWQKNGSVVAMTGDGVNDAPALKAASIGISMGRSGTEVARQSSAIILTDDNFATIVSAIEEGRAVFGNIRRTIEYLLSGNLAEILLMLGAALAGWPVPLAPIHLLWINLVTDGLPSLALAAEPVPRDILKRSTRVSNGRLANRAFYKRIIGIGWIEGLLALGIYGSTLRSGGHEAARSLTFTFLVFTELFRSFACRSEERTFFELGPKSNLFQIAAVALPLLFQIWIPYSPLFREVFAVEPLSLNSALGLVGLTLIPVSVLELWKVVKRRRPHAAFAVS